MLRASLGRPLSLLFALAFQRFFIRGSRFLLDEMETNTIALLKEAGRRGLLLCELAEQLERPATDVLKVVESLSANGYVKKVEEKKKKGESVLRIIWNDKDEPKWDTLQGCPCFACTDIDVCGAGQPTSPWSCDRLNMWIKDRTQHS